MIVLDPSLTRACCIYLEGRLKIQCRRFLFGEGLTIRRDNHFIEHKVSNLWNNEVAPEHTFQEHSKTKRSDVGILVPQTGRLAFDMTEAADTWLQLH